MNLVRKLNHSLLVVSISAITSPVNAAPGDSRPLFFTAETGWSNMANGHVSPNQTKDKKQFGYRMSMGYLFNINTKFSLGPEVAYGYYGKISYQNPIGLVVYYESTGWSLLASVKHKTTNLINLYLKAGATEVSQHYDITGPNTVQGGFYQHKFSPTIIAAGSYNLTQHVELIASYTHIFANRAPLSGKPQLTYTNVDQITTIDAVMLGVVYNV